MFKLFIYNILAWFDFSWEMMSWYEKISFVSVITILILNCII